MVKISVVTGTYNRLHYLVDMLDSVRISVGKLSYEIIVVDGGSDDGTLEFLRDQSDVHLIEHGELRGAIAAFNDGVAAARGDYVVLANDDIVFVERAIERAYQFMIENPETGVGCFYTDRAGREPHVAIMPAHTADGRMVNAYYGGLVIVPRWLGDKLEWWTLPGARTYGGDNSLCSRCIEAGYGVVPIEGAHVHEYLPKDALNTINNPPLNDNHPDTQAYLKVFPHGPELGHARAFEAPPEFAPKRRILYAPIYEERHEVQHAQKSGLRRALQRRGIVREVDYLKHGAEAVLDVAKGFLPDLVITQLHYPEPFGPDHARRLREILPKAMLINWNGDVYPRATDPKYGPPYLELLRYFDLQTVVNATDVPNYHKAGIPAMWWQNAYESEGVGVEPDEGVEYHDIVFLGNGYSPSRQRFGNFLVTLSHDLKIYGEHWPAGLAGPGTLYDFRRGCQIYCSSKIALGDSEWTHEARGFVSNRLFQIMAAGGALAMQQYFEGMDMLGFEDGVHLAVWKDQDELKRKLVYYLEHDKVRQAIVRRAQREVLAKHSFEARLDELWPYTIRKPAGFGVRPVSKPTNTDPTLAIYHEGSDG